MAMRVQVYPGVDARVEDLYEVLQACVRVGEEIADVVRRRTVGDEPTESIGVAGPHIRGATVYAFGTYTPGWHGIFQSLGGQGWRPPPAPLRSAAEAARAPTRRI